MRSEEKKFYNYVSFYRGIPVYVGKGIGKRWIHTVNGKSGSELINDFHFRYKYLDDMPLDTYIVKSYPTDDDALKGERNLIEKYLPYCNKCSGRFHLDEYDFYPKLVGVCRDYGFSRPELLDSKFDFRFLFTPKGLFCKKIQLSDNSPFEYATEPYHIKVKSSLYKEFPEYFLQFMCHKRDEDGISLSSYHTKRLFVALFEMGNFDLFSGLDVDLEWKVNALQGGSLDFAKNFGFTYNGFDIEYFKHKNTIADSHIKTYTEHLKIVEEVRVKKERKLQKRESARLLLEEKRELSDFIAIKVSDKVLDHAKTTGFDFSGFGQWLNMSVDVKPYRSISRVGSFKVISEDDFLLANLNKFKKS